MPVELRQLRVTVPHELVELARKRETNLSQLVRRALAEVAGVDVDDFPVRRPGRPRKRAGVPDGEAAA